MGEAGRRDRTGDRGDRNSSESRSALSGRFVLVILLALLIAQAFYAVKLNRDFYAEHAPFFDSCSYTNQLADLAEITRNAGVLPGLRHALHGNVALPFLETIPAALFFRPDRTFGIWLQWIWLAAFAASLYFYFNRWRRIGPWTTLCLILPLISFARVYDWNGGLADFRMDLSLYIFTSLFAVWFLVTYETDEIYPWLLAGIAAGLGCLARATAPVYLLVMFGPLLLLRLMRSPHRLALLYRWLIMAVPVAVCAALFLGYNYRYLHFYYVEWSPDANRHLPLAEAARHIALAGMHLGALTAVVSLAAFGLNLALGWRNLRQLDWRLVWIAAAAPAFLVFRGAGLNPFVSMPAVFGIVLFFYLPFRSVSQVPHVVCACAVAVTIYNVATAKKPQYGSSTNTTRIAAIRELVDRVKSHAVAPPSGTVNYIMPVLGELHSCSLQNVLRYEYGAAAESGGFRIRPDVALKFPNETGYTASDEFLWNRNTAGATDEERMGNLVRYAQKNVDFLILPTADTAAMLSRTRPYNYINTRTAEMRTKLFAGTHWEQIGDPVQFTPEERYELFQRAEGSR